MTSSEQAYKIETLRPDQVEYVATFLEGEKAGGLKKDEWLQKFSILWDQNPFFDKASHARGWVITDERQAVLGFLGNIPVRYVRNGEEEPCYWATTWFVAEKARVRSLDLFRKFMAQEGILLDTTPTTGVELILAKRFKFSRLDSGWIKTDYFLPIHLGACVNDVRRRLGSRPLLKPLSLPVCVAVKAVTWCRSFVNRPKRKPGIEVREIHALPGDINAWWTGYKTRQSYTLVRDERAMRWLFYTGPFSHTRKVLEVREGSSLLGFVCLKLIQQPTFAVVELADLALLDLSEDVLWAIIVELRKTVFLWSKDIAYLRANAFSDAMGALLSTAGFWRLEGRARYYYFDRNKLLSSDDIYATPVDGDRSLFP